MELSQELLDRLLAESLRARDLAHAPYSKYRVGVAILDEQGRIHVGANMENASFPQGWCAEPSALTAMIMAVRAEGSAHQPCGKEAFSMLAPTWMRPCSSRMATPTRYLEYGAWARSRARSDSASRRSSSS